MVMNSNCENIINILRKEFEEMIKVRNAVFDKCLSACSDLEEAEKNS